MRYILNAALLSVCLLAGCGGPPPSDATLVARFEHNQPAFQKLADMILADHSLRKVHRTYIQGTSPTDERLAEYRSLLEKVRCQSVTRWDHQGDFTVEVTAFAGGDFPDDGIYKGFEFFPHGLPERLKKDVVDNLDGDPTRSTAGTQLYRKLNDHWYLTFLY